MKPPKSNCFFKDKSYPWLPIQFSQSTRRRFWFLSILHSACNIACYNYFLTSEFVLHCQERNFSCELGVLYQHQTLVNISPTFFKNQFKVVYLSHFLIKNKYDPACEILIFPLTKGLWMEEQSLNLLKRPFKTITMNLVSTGKYERVLVPVKKL